MTPGLVILLFGSVLAPPKQANSLGAPGCGPSDVRFDVKTATGQHALPAPDSGKALIIFLQDDARFESIPRPTTRFGIDGTWVGATHSNSYFYTSVVPGEHHLCANWQSKGVLIGASRSTAAMQFIAEAGKIYSFRARDYLNKDRPPAEVKLEAIDNDEAQILMNSFELSSSRPKK
jgi:hypothetical protein